jgi:hypothetical protein
MSRGAEAPAGNSGRSVKPHILAARRRKIHHAAGPTAARRRAALRRAVGVRPIAASGGEDRHVRCGRAARIGKEIGVGGPKKGTGSARRAASACLFTEPPESGTMHVWRLVGHPGRNSPLGMQGTSMSNHSRYQQKVIRNYYENREAIALQRVQELVTELYLSEGKKRAKHWKTLIGHLEALGVPADQIQHLQQKDNPALVAGLVEKLMAKQK